MSNTKNYEYFQSKLNDLNQKVFELEKKVSYLEDFQLKAERTIKDLEVITDGLMRRR